MSVLLAQLLFPTLLILLLHFPYQLKAANDPLDRRLRQTFHPTVTDEFKLIQDVLDGWNLLPLRPIVMYPSSKSYFRILFQDTLLVEAWYSNRPDISGLEIYESLDEITNLDQFDNPPANMHQLHDKLIHVSHNDDWSGQIEDFTVAYEAESRGKKPIYIIDQKSRALHSIHENFIIVKLLKPAMKLSDYNYLRRSEFKELIKYHAEKLKLLDIVSDEAKEDERDLRTLIQNQTKHAAKVADPQTIRMIEATKKRTLKSSEMTRAIYSLIKDIYREIRNSVELLRQIYTRLEKYSSQDINLCGLSEETILLKNWNEVMPYDRSIINLFVRQHMADSLYFATNELMFPPLVSHFPKSNFFAASHLEENDPLRFLSHVSKNFYWHPDFDAEEDINIDTQLYATKGNIQSCIDSDDLLMLPDICTFSGIAHQLLFPIDMPQESRTLRSVLDDWKKHEYGNRSPRTTLIHAISWLKNFKSLDIDQLTTNTLRMCDDISTSISMRHAGQPNLYSTFGIGTREKLLYARMVKTKTWPSIATLGNNKTFADAHDDFRLYAQRAQADAILPSIQIPHILSWFKQWDAVLVSYQKVLRQLQQRMI